MEYKQGDTRADGFRFLRYEKRNGRFREKWACPASYDRAIQYSRNYKKTYKKAKQ